MNNNSEKKDKLKNLTEKNTKTFNKNLKRFIHME